MRTRDDKKESKIRQKTMEIIVKEGLEGLSMHKVAKKARVSVNTIYLNFKNKEDLIIRVYQGIADRMETVLLNGFSPDMDFARGLKVQWDNRLDYFIRYPLHIAFTERIRHSPLNRKAMKLQDGKFRAAMQAFYHNAIRKNQLVPLSREVYWSLAFAPLYQLLKFQEEATGLAGETFNLTKQVLDEAFQRTLVSLTP